MKELTGMRQKYQDQVRAELIKEGTFRSVMQVPKIEKVVVAMGLGSVKENEKEFDEIVGQLKAICGQKPVVSITKKSIAGFSVREGMRVGAKVTLRGQKMYNFLDKTVNYVLPRTRDFRGLSRNGFDGNGNYSFGFEDQMVFLELDPSKIKRRQGLQITIVTSAKSNAEAELLLEKLGMPFVKKEE